MITRLSNCTVFVLDQDIALKFYAETLGFTVTADVTAPNGFRWLSVAPPKQPDLNIALLKVESGGASPLSEFTASRLKEILTDGSLGMGVFETDDCRKTYEELSARGVKFQKEPTDEFFGVQTVFEDPFGNYFTLVEPKGNRSK